MTERKVHDVSLTIYPGEKYQKEGRPTHNILLGAGVIIIEGLDFSGVPPGDYELLCLPLKLKDSDGAPARVFLREV